MRIDRVAILSLFALGASSLLGQSSANIILPNVAGFALAVGQPFSQTFTCSGTCGGNSWSIAPQIPGLTMNASTGVLSGTPTTVGSTAATVTFTFVGPNTFVVASRGYNFNVLAPLTFLTPTPLAPATSGTAVSRTIQISNPSLISVPQSTLPEGVSINIPSSGSTTATLSGTFPAVSVPTTYTFTLLADDTAQQVSQAYSIVVNPPVSCCALAPTTAEVGVPYSGLLSATGGTAPLTYSIGAAAPALPPGLTLNSATGAITGTPSQAGTFPLPSSAIDTNGSASGASVTLIVVARPVITTTALPNGQVGVPYAAALAGTGGRGALTWSITSGALPAGLALNSATGAITGVPSAAGSSPFTVSLTDAAGVAVSAPLSIVIVPAALTITTNALPGGTVAQPYAATILATGGNQPYTFSLAAGQLPPGLTLALNGTLTGTPATGSAGNYTFTVRVADVPLPGAYAGTSVTATYTVTIAPPPITILPTTLPVGIVGQSYTATLTASGGTLPYTWSLVSGSLPAGLTLNTNGTITGVPAANTAGTYTFTVGVSGTGIASPFSPTVTAVFTLTVKPSGITILTTSLPSGSVGQTYNTSIAATGGTPPYVFTIAAGSLPAGISLSPAGVLSGTPTTASVATFTVMATDVPGQTATQALTLTITAALTIATTTLPDGALNATYNGAVTASGGTPPYSFSIAAGSLPPGLSMDLAGNITGRPTTAGTFNFTAGVTDSLQANATKPLSITIQAGLHITTTSLPQATRNAAYSTTIAAVGGLMPYTFTASNLPAGLTLGQDGTLSGTPTVSGSFTVSVTVTDKSNATDTARLGLTILDAPVILTASLPNGTVGTNYSATLSGQGVTPFTWSVSAGSLPPGLALNGTTGAITGTPSQAGTFNFTVRLSDGNQPALSVTQPFTITVGVPALPGVLITPIQNPVSAAQPPLGVTLNQTYPLDLAGTATLAFQPVSGPGDPGVVFANNTSTLNFTIPAGQTAAIPPSGIPFALQTGTTAGTVTVNVALSANGQTLNPNPAATLTITIPRAAPVISSVTISSTSSGFNVVVTGYSNTREITAATFSFTTNSGSTLSTNQIPVAVASTFQTYYGSAASASFGGMFQLTVPFTLSQGSVSGLQSVQVTLTNSVGSTTASGTF